MDELRRILLVVGLLVLGVTLVLMSRNMDMEKVFREAMEKRGISVVETKKKKEKKNVEIEVRKRGGIGRDVILSPYPDIAFCESYMRGEWETGDLHAVLERVTGEETEKEIAKRIGIGGGIGVLLSRLANPLKRDGSTKENIAAHYDIGNDLYEKMLGKVMAYTCAYFHRKEISLEEAQVAKFDLIARKLRLRKGMRVLDIGCGYGVFASHIASKYGCDVVGCTLSGEQKSLFDKKNSMRNVEILLKDYRHLSVQEEGLFDAIVSIGFFEHIGEREYPLYFSVCKRMSKPGARILLHTIGRSTHGQVSKNHFLSKYIFPGGSLPSTREILKASDGEWILEDWQNFGLSYAETLKRWRENVGDWKGLDERKYPPSFRRMWDLYLTGCRVAFEKKEVSLWQVVFTKIREEKERILFRPEDLNGDRSLQS